MVAAMVSTVKIKLAGGQHSLSYVISDEDLEDARGKAYAVVNSLKRDVRELPDLTKASKQTVDNFVMDAVLLCIASERRGKGIFAGTVIEDFEIVDGVDMPTFGTA
jgi:hypothetical protein